MDRAQAARRGGDGWPELNEVKKSGRAALLFQMSGWTERGQGVTAMTTIWQQPKEAFACEPRTMLELGTSMDGCPQPSDGLDDMPRVPVHVTIVCFYWHL